MQVKNVEIKFLIGKCIH